MERDSVTHLITQCFRKTFMKRLRDLNYIPALDEYKQIVADSIQDTELAFPHIFADSIVADPIRELLNEGAMWTYQKTLEIMQYDISASKEELNPDEED